MSDADAALEASTADIQRDLARELAIDPSPEFLARVRGAIRDAPPRRSRLPFWTPIAVAAAAVVLVAAIVLVRRESAQPPAIAEQIAPAAAPSPESDPPAVAANVPPAPSPSDRRRVTPSPPRRVADAARARREEPEVLVPPGQLEAIGRLLAAVRAGRLDGTTLAFDEGVREIVIPPLKIDPIETPGSETDTRPPGPVERPRESPRSAF